ncbi:DUF1499 domain-containing protein [Alteromonas sp. 5E99-2]|uniref:DUF1499 domain-containing protein n=1 Tax=Alteromonas sp. 5E99-2 TaxID=2817683 RepID=UPI00325A7ACB
MNKAVLTTAVVALLMVLLPGPLYKFNVLELAPAFSSFRFGVYVGGVAFLLIITQFLFARSSMNIAVILAATTCVIVAVGIPVSMMKKAKGLPPIHDITTDVQQPPEFNWVLKDRADAPNPAEYLAGEVTKQQLDAYPELATQVFNASVDDVQTAATSVVNELGWTLVHSDTSLHTIEATEASFWFGFKDDVVIRIQGQDGQTRVDVRSKSRVGRSDLGANAQRIRTFQSALSKQIQ